MIQKTFDACVESGTENQNSRIYYTVRVRNEKKKKTIEMNGVSRKFIRTRNNEIKFVSENGNLASDKVSDEL